MSGLTFDIEPDFVALHERCKSESLISIERMYAVWQAARHIARAGIAGDIVECGVWRGGAMMLAALTLAAEGDLSRRLWLYDTFEGMTEPSAADVHAISGRPARDILAEAARTAADPYWAIAGREVVARNMAAAGYPDRLVTLVEGRVEDTLPATAPDRVALLRLDTDWYDSTRHELIHLWPRLVSGGVLIVDDYGYWSGARRAVDEFFARLPDPPLLARTDYTGRMAVKR